MNTHYFHLSPITVISEHCHFIFSFLLLHLTHTPYKTSRAPFFFHRVQSCFTAFMCLIRPNTLHWLHMIIETRFEEYTTTTALVKKYLMKDETKQTKIQAIILRKFSIIVERFCVAYFHIVTHAQILHSCRS